MKKSLLILVCFLVGGSSFAQGEIFRYSNSLRSQGKGITITGAGDTILVGCTTANANSTLGILRFATSQQTEGFTGREYESSLGSCGEAVAPTADNGVIIAGYKSLPDTNGSLMSQPLILKLDEAGDVIWSNSFGDSIIGRANSIAQAVDTGYLVAGVQGRNVIGEPFNAFTAKLSDEGNREWIHYTQNGVVLNAIAQLGDSTIVGVGRITLSPVEPSQPYVVRLSKAGAFLDEKIFPRPGEFFDLALLGGDSLVFVGTKSEDFVNNLSVIKCDRQFTEDWNIVEGGAWNDYAAAVAMDGNEIVVVGATESFSTGEFLNSDMWLLRISDEGNVIQESIFGTTINEAASDIVVTGPARYVLSGTEGFGERAVVVTTDSSGVVDFTSSASEADEISNLVIRVFPNPVLDVVNVQFHGEVAGPVQLRLSDNLGRVVAESEFRGSCEQSLGGLPAGVYYLTLVKEDRSITRQIIKH